MISPHCRPDQAFLNLNVERECEERPGSALKQRINTETLARAKGLASTIWIFFVGLERNSLQHVETRCRSEAFLLESADDKFRSLRSTPFGLESDSRFLNEEQRRGKVVWVRG
jgi:hypothetical protein